MHRLTLVGIGPGTKQYILPKAVQAMEEADVIIAAKRVIPMICEMFPNGEIVQNEEAGQGRKEDKSKTKRSECEQKQNKKQILQMGGIAQTIARIEQLIETKKVALLVSGDPLMYSLLRTLKNDETAKHIQMEVIPGIGSLQMLGAKCGISMEEASIISVHGRAQKRGSIAMAVSEKRDCFFLCSKEQGPAWLSGIMLEYGLDHVTIYAGSELSYDEEQIVIGSPKEMAAKEFPSLCVTLIHNDTPKKAERVGLLRDSDFVRGKTPMTKEEVRAIIIQKMELEPDSIVWDIGAGTGSITIESARFCPFGEVYAVEQNDEAVKLIEKNRQKFRVDNVYIVHKTATESLEELPCPDVVFIGGSTGQLEQILDYIAQFQKNIPVVVSAVTVETLTSACQNLGKYDKDYEMTQISIGKSRKLGKYHIVDQNNMVTLLCAHIS